MLYVGNCAVWNHQVEDLKKNRMLIRFCPEISCYLFYYTFKPRVIIILYGISVG